MSFFIAFSFAAACGAAMNSRSAAPFRGTRNVCRFLPFLPGEVQLEERKMPVLILWAVPAIVVVGGGIYLISHMH
ncbi:hypothetical protein [Bradyrhizobium glycinis]|uniref:hypothetical protein n=1 Tax=Bradyrhizobium glycinis TaxID=2751812 RepID=UPI0018D6B262|nr:hypothetical protein [Bradyrhizobium glycinis]MBH5371920.1 hypothetical protein [Bradyrhizobium glycinis]